MLPPLSFPSGSEAESHLRWDHALSRAAYIGDRLRWDLRAQAFVYLGTALMVDTPSRTPHQDSQDLIGSALQFNFSLCPILIPPPSLHSFRFLLNILNPTSVSASVPKESNLRHWFIWYYGINTTLGVRQSWPWILLLVLSSWVTLEKYLTS